jgi:lysophospholipase L1-like esterase
MTKSRAMLPRFPVALTCLLLAGYSFAAQAPASDMTLIPASDSRFLLEGRFDRANPSQLVVIWAGSRIGLDFEGSALRVIFGEATGQTFFNVKVDGVTEIANGAAGRFIWPGALESGRHHLEIFKRSEADAGHVVFRGVELAAGAKAWAPAAPAYKFKLQFIGDSITVGANNEDGAVDQWEDRRTHNHALSYGYLTSLALGADHQAMAVSGMGICEGFVPMIAGETWDKVYPRDVPTRADLAAWVPDVVCVNLGENDTAFTQVTGRPFPPGFTAGYVALIKAMRAAWPAAHIVLLRGGMHGGAQSPQLRVAWETAVKELEAGDPRVGHFVFQHWTGHHPRVSDHRIMADELTAWLRAQPFMARMLEKTK